MMTLYHGSNVVIDEIDLSKSRKGKDFGCGFYLNADKNQAMEMAIRTSRRMMEGTPVLNTYKFDENILNIKDTPLAIKIFDGYSIEWAEFIMMNRKNVSDTPAHKYDIVIGPIANDTVGLQMRRFTQGYISIERMIEELKFNKPSIQYFFGTELAISYLEKI